MNTFSDELSSNKHSKSTAAAVLIPIITSNLKLEDTYKINTSYIPINGKIILTIRSDSVEHHKGQISLPGGRFESTDSTLLETALRETEEEIGLSRALVNIVDEITPVNTVVTNFLVTPFVALVDSPFHYKINKDEIDHIIEVPISHLMNAKNTVMEWRNFDGLKIQLKSYTFNDYRIWGATARILELFLEKLK